MAEEPRIATSEAVAMRNMEGFVPNTGNSPMVRQMMYPVSDGVGWYGGNHVMPISSAGLVETPHYVYQTGGVIGENPMFVMRGGGENVVVGYRVGVGRGNGENANIVNQENTVYLNRGGSGGSSGLGASPTFDSRSNASDQWNDEGVDDQSPVKKVKFLCSFGGKILPRPNDGVLRYVGGQTRIISVKRDISFQDLVHKMIDVYGKPVVIKYQLPEGELDALVSVSCPEDLENMMDEYGKLVESCSNGSAKLRVFLFSASDLDSSGLLQFGDLLDSGQRYIDAVNGISEGVGSGIARKVSVGSETSTHNSDGQIGGSDCIDSSIYGQGDGFGISSSSVSSPRVGVVSSHENPMTVGYIAPTPMMYAPSMPMRPAENLNGFPSSLLAETEFKRPVPTTMHPQAPLGYGLQRPYGVDFQPATTYMQAYVDPRQQLAMQGGYLTPRGVGMAGSVYRYAETQPAVRDNVSISNQQFLPAVQMPPASFSHSVGMNTNVQQVMQPAQTRGDFYLGENTLNTRGVPSQPYVPSSVYQPQSPSYPPGSVYQPPGSVYQPQPPNYPPSSIYRPQSPTYPPTVPQTPTYPHTVPQSPNYPPSSAYQPHHVFLSDGRVTHQPGVFPEKLPKMGDCLMCQKQLPHTHSDTLAQDHRHGIDSSVSDTNLIFHRAQLEHNLGSQPINSVALSGASDEPEYLGSRTQTRAMTRIDHMTSDSGRSGFTEDLEVQPEDRTSPKLAAPDNSGLLFSRGEIGKVFNVTSPNAVIFHDIPQPHHEDVFPKSSAADQIRQEPIVSLSPVHTSTAADRQSSTEHSSNNSSLVAEEDALASGVPYDRVRPVGGRVEGNYINPQAILRSNESLIHKHKKEDYIVSMPQISGQECFPSNKFTQPGVIPDRVHLMTAGTLPSMPSGAAHLESAHPLDSTQLTQPVMLGTSGPYSYFITESQQNIGAEQMISQEQLHGNPVISLAGLDYPLYSTQPVEEKTDASGLQSRRAPFDAFDSPAVPSSADAMSTYGGMLQGNWKHSPENSLFSNQDPWTLLHDQHSLPPNINNVAANEQAFVTRKDEFLQKPSGHLNKDADHKHLSSNKDVAEEYIKQELKAAAEEVLNNPSKQMKPDADSERNLSTREEVSDEQELKAVAEGVAAMVLQMPVPNDSSVQVNELSPGVGHEKVLDSSVEAQSAARVEEVETKLPDKENIVGPLSGGIGRLQIIKNSDLEELCELGSGTFGTVYHGKWRGTDVAIKRINDRCFAGKPSERSRMIDDFWNEAIKLADLHHPNVVAFYGVVLDGPGDSVATVTEYMVNGSLRQALQRTLNRRKRLLIAMDAAFGMEYLHGKNIVHFDLKSDNLLVNLKDPQRPICKVGDLGLSKVKAHTLISGGVRGTLPWMAPELLNGSSSLVSEKVDVFSFGIVMWELLTGEEPYADLHYGVIIGGIVSNTLRPIVPESCDPEWRSLMERCWSANPSERPNFTEIADQLRSMAASLPAKAQVH